MEQVNRDIENVLIDKTSEVPHLFNRLSLLTAVSLSLGYLLISYLLIGFRTDQLVLVMLFNTLYFTSRVTRRFILSFSIFIVYWIIFDFMKAFPNYHVNEVAIGSLYELEKSFFGIRTGSAVLTPNEYFSLHHSPAFDFISGVFYLCWVPVPLLFATFLYFKNKNWFFRFAFSFLLVNIIGFIVYYLYPAAPPWYITRQGFEFVADTPGNTAGLSRFDALTGFSIFESLYAKSSNVFAAMPSLHAAYMLIVVYFGFRLKMGYWNILFVTVMAGIWFSAIYTSHHYLLDVLAGAAVAIGGVLLLEYFIKTSAGKKLFEKVLVLTNNN